MSPINRTLFFPVFVQDFGSLVLPSLLDLIGDGCPGLLRLVLADLGDCSAKCCPPLSGGLRRLAVLVPRLRENRVIRRNALFLQDGRDLLLEHRYLAIVVSRRVGTSYSGEIALRLERLFGVIAQIPREQFLNGLLNRVQSLHDGLGGAFRLGLGPSGRVVSGLQLFANLGEERFLHRFDGQGRR